MRIDRSFLSLLTFRPSNRYFLRRFISIIHSSLWHQDFIHRYPLHFSYRDVPRRGGFIRFTGTSAFQCLDARQSEKGSPLRRVSPPEISYVLLAESLGFIIYAHSQEKRIVRVQRYVSPGGNRRRKVQVGTGRRMIARARDSPSCFIHACLVNLDIPVRITWRTWLYPGSGLVNPLWSGVWQIGRNQRKKKRKLWIFSLSFFFLLFQEECCAFFD